MVFNATFNKLTVISWWLVLLVEETRVLRENHQLVARHWQTVVIGKLDKLVHKETVSQLQNNNANLKAKIDLIDMRLEEQEQYS